MKKFFALGIVFCSLLVTGCGTSNGRLAKIDKHVIKSVPCYTPDFSTQDIRFARIDGLNYAFHFFNDVNVPYYNVIDYFKDFIDMSSEDNKSYCEYSYELTGHKFTILNEGQKETATIDFINQNITFSNFGGFQFFAKTPSFSINAHIQGGEKYFVGEQTFDYVAPKEYVIDLSKYHMKAYLEAGQAYLPFYLFRNIFQLSTMFVPYYNGNGLYIMIGYGNSESTLPLLEIMRKEGDPNFYKSNDLLQFNYDLMALTIDHNFGLKERLSRIDGHLIKYFEKGAYEALAPYKNRLMSTEPNVSNEAMNEIFGTILNDGGHSGYGCLNAFSDKVSPYQREGEVAHTFSRLDLLTNKRKEAKLDPYSVLNIPESGPSPIGYYQEIDDVAYVTFDSFSAPTQELKPEKINESNYYLDTISLIYYSNKQIKEHNIKKVVIDLSCNGGGVVFTCLFASSWLSNGTVSYKSASVKDNAYFEAKVHGDINLNGVFDEGDYLDSSVQKYCIISNTSFSCGNLMPCLLEDNSNTKFIGERSGGGCCNVIGNYYLAIGGSMRLSYMFTFLRNSSTKDNFVTVEDGVVPSFHPIVADEAHASEYYDRNTLTRIINED